MRRKSALTTGEIAQYCDVNFRTVLRWIERGKLRAYKLPGRGDNRVRIDDFREFLEQHKMPIPELFTSPRRHRALIVEGDAHIAGSICHALEHVGFETVVAPDGFRAGTYLGKYTPAVMTLDLQMPGLTGVNILSFVRATQDASKTKILVVSAMPAADLQQAMFAGADDVLQKPFDNNQLVEKVKSLVAGSTVRVPIYAQNTEAVCS
ncbi:MAG: response regulator [Pirellulales bacterium]|nr:response regulator [Pirellulales bacterium]